MILVASQLFLYTVFFPAHISAADTLAANQSLSGDQTLVSRYDNFEMGFFRPGKSPNYYIGIWYKTISNQTVVWVANRETPISDRFSSSLRIIDGNLVLLNESNSPIWSTNMNSTATPASVVLLDDGNLVLRYGSHSSAPIWQSFDHPTHIFLPGGKFGYNKRTNAKQVLTSWRNREDPGMGLFTLELQQNDKEYVIKWNRSQLFWVSGRWNDQTHIFSFVPEMRLNYIYNFSYVDNENESYFTYSLYNPSIISRFIIDVSGQIQQLTWLDSTREWNLFWAQPRRFYKVYGGCGAFGVSNQQMLPPCTCLTDFEPRSQSDWSLGNFSGGCVRKIDMNCSVIMENSVFILSYVLKKFLSAVPKNEILQLDELECRRSCSNDCACNAYTYILNVCQLWNRETLNNISTAFVSKELYVPASAFYIKVASKDLPRFINNSHVNLGAVFRSVACVVFILGVILLIVRIKNLILVGETTMEGSLVAFVYRDLQMATKNFSGKLGGGSFGSVFKGVLNDSSIVAVKKLESVNQGEKEFRSEVSTIGIIQHVNIVRLRGFCAQGKRRLLVYDYMPNGSLNSHLFCEKHDNLLTWETRYQIALGTARGLVYLHEKCRDRIIHCDIKPENILLDANLCPKVADFGMAKLIGRDFSKVLTTMRGTRGYLAPEWLSGLAVTAKVDVFSYGMMLFELVSGKRNSYQSEDKSFAFFPSLAANLLMAGGDILSLLDSRLNREASVEEVTKVFKVAYWCIQHEEDNRPSMSEVEHILGGVLDVSTPPIPQYIKLFAEEIMEDFLFFKQSSSIGTQKPEAQLLDGTYSNSSSNPASSL